MNLQKSLIGAALLALGGAGCYHGGAFSASTWNPLNLPVNFWETEKPVRFDVEAEKLPILNPLQWPKVAQEAPWTPLGRSLSEVLGKPVAVNPGEEFQIAAHLAVGRAQFALIGADRLSQLRQDIELGEVVAVTEGRTRRGLIVADAKSNIRSMADLVGQRFAFGPSGDSVLDAGTLDAIRESGVDPDKMARELVPIPGGRQFHISSREAAQAIIYEIGVDAGVIDEAEYESFPQTGGRYLPLVFTFSKDQFRVLGRTREVDVDGFGRCVVVAAHDTPPEMVAQVRKFLLSAESDDPTVVRSLGLTRFVPPGEGMLAETGGPS